MTYFCCCSTELSFLSAFHSYLQKTNKWYSFSFLGNANTKHPVYKAFEMKHHYKNVCKYISIILNAKQVKITKCSLKFKDELLSLFHSLFKLAISLFFLFSYFYLIILASWFKACLVLPRVLR